MKSLVLFPLYPENALINVVNLKLAKYEEFIWKRRFSITDFGEGMGILSLLNTWSLFWLKLVKSVEVFLKKAKYLYFLECEVRFQRD